MLAVSSFANATTLTFDTLTQYQNVGSYGGLDFSSFVNLNTTQYVASGYLNGVVSPNNVAVTWNSSGRISSTSAFTFNSVYLTSGWNNGQTVDIIGSLQGTQLYSRSMVVDTHAPTLGTFDWVGIDTLSFSTYGGTHAGYAGAGAFLAFDNLTFNEAVSAVPEPSSIALLGLGLFGFAASRRRKAAK